MRRLCKYRQQMRRPDRTRRIFQRGAHPSRLQQFAETRRQFRLAAQSVRQAVDGRQQAIPDRIHIQLITEHNRHQVAVTKLQQLDQPMLDINGAMRSCLAQAGGVGEGLCAVVVEAAQEGGEVAWGHDEIYIDLFSRHPHRRHMPMPLSSPTRIGEDKLAAAYERSFQLSAWMMLPSL